RRHTRFSRDWSSDVCSSDLKTFLAVAMGVTALKAHRAKRIVLTRPAVEAGENLGFLPGDLQEKVDPYLRPLYDALYYMLGVEQRSEEHTLNSSHVKISYAGY